MQCSLSYQKPETLIPPCRAAVVRVCSSEAVSDVHIGLPEPLLQASRVAEHESVAVWKPKKLGDIPKKLLLHPIRSSQRGEAATGKSRALPSEGLQELFLGWLEAQGSSQSTQVNALLVLLKEGASQHSSYPCPGKNQCAGPEKTTFLVSVSSLSDPC